MRIYDKSDIEYIKSIFDIESLKRQYKWAEDDIQDIKKYMQTITEQVQKALKAEYRHTIVIRREKSYYGDKKVYYYVSIKSKIFVDGIEQTRNVTPHFKEYEKLHQKFGGLEKKKAVEYAESLRKQFNFQVVKDGF